MSMPGSLPLGGSCDARFVAVRDALVRNMTEPSPAGAEVGAAVSIVYEGETVVDLWAGWRDRARTLPWEKDTITCMMSVGKAVAATCVLRLVDAGRIGLDQAVADVWPEFGAAGKAAITLRTVLSHLAGLPFADAAGPGSLYTTGTVATALAAQRPEWEPGSTPCYHSFTYGLLCAELVRRVDGRSIGRFLREEIAEPLGVDYAFGLTDAALARCADFIETPGTPSLEGIKRNPASPLHRAWRPMPRDEDFNSRLWRQCEFPSAAGHGNPRGLARLFGALAGGGALRGSRLLSADLTAEACVPRWDGIEWMTQRHFRMGMGFMISSPVFEMGGKPRNFGHGGIGGAIAFGDPERALGFSYCGNRMAPVADTGPFARALIEAMYASVD